MNYTSLPEATGLPAPAGPGAVWGTLYVTEGATLGGRVLRHRIEARLGPVPARFLDGHSDRTQPMWRDLGRLADLYIRSRQDRRLARQAAIQAFAAFSTWAGDNAGIWLSTLTGARGRSFGINNDVPESILPVFTGPGIKRVDPIWALSHR